MNGCVTLPIKERDTSCAPISLPAFTGMPFPKVLHRSETGCQVRSHLFKSLRNNLSNIFTGTIKQSGIENACVLQAPHPSATGRKSIFARQIAAQRVKEGAQMSPATANDGCIEKDPCHAADDRALACMNVSSLFTRVALILLILLLLFFVCNCCLRATAGVWTRAPGP